MFLSQTVSLFAALEIMGTEKSVYIRVQMVSKFVLKLLRLFEGVLTQGGCTFPTQRLRRRTLCALPFEN